MLDELELMLLDDSTDTLLEELVGADDATDKLLELVEAVSLLEEELLSVSPWHPEMTAKPKINKHCTRNIKTTYKWLKKAKEALFSQRLYPNR